MKSFYFFTAVSLLVLTVNSQQVIKAHNNSKLKIAFGSCNKFFRNHKSPIFEDVANQNPDVWIWLGDVSYNDIMILPAIWVPEPNPENNRQKLAATKNDPSYQKMLTKVNAEIGVWDDHDYGLNNSGVSFIHKDQMRQVWLDFFNEPKESERRTRKGGIYSSYYLGEEKKVKIILTDVRWNRSEKDILGEDQWIWLEKELSSKEVELFILGSGSQFLPDDRFIPETWDMQSKERLYSLINKTSASLIFITGDVHYAELMEHPCSLKKVGYRLVEITSSGLSFNINQSGDIFGFGNKFIFTPTYNTVEDRFVGNNYGIVEIEWDSSNHLNSNIKLQAFNQGNFTPVLEKIITLRELQKDSSKINSYTSCVVDDISPQKRWFEFASGNLKKVILEFDTKIISEMLQHLTTILLLLYFWAYLVKQVISAFKQPIQQDIAKKNK